ncbi:MAG TPA: DUF459 domain-containing protein [Thermoleophilaceae bacterium]|jgi:hypothetical protein
MDEHGRDRDLTMPAGRVLIVVVIALVVAAVLNSEAAVRAGEGMKPGPTRDIVLSVARPLDDVTGAIGLHEPRKGLDLAFGQESKTASGTELEKGSTAILRRRARQRAQSFPQPTRRRPLTVLVTGDSEAQFVGEQLIELAPKGLIDVDVVPRNGTGLTNPSFFNWEVNARDEIRDRKPDAVVMVIGGNDGFNLDVDGVAQAPGSTKWETEYARRAAVVMRVLADHGRRPVYWVPPPTARDEVYNRIYAVQNSAIERAAPAAPGARYVDVYSTINKGRYSDELRIGGRRVLARQPDGVHFTREGAVVPARLILRAMSRDYPALAGP